MRMSCAVGLLNMSVMKRPSWQFHWWSWLMRRALRDCSENDVLKLASKLNSGPMGLRESMKREIRDCLAPSIQEKGPGYEACKKWWPPGGG